MMVLIAVLAGIALWRRANKSPELRFSNGRIFRIEAVSFGTNHVVGIYDWWNVPLRKILPNSFLQHLTPERGQSRDDTQEPALVGLGPRRGRGHGQICGLPGDPGQFRR